MRAMLLFDPVFVAWGAEHILWLLAGVASMLLWIGWGRLQMDERRQQAIGLIMALIPAAIWTVVSLKTALFDDPVNWELVFPLHVCFLLNLLMPVMLWRRSFALFEVFYFVVMAGCIQALITPDLSTVFPDLINIRYFFVHIGLVQSILYAIIVYRFRPGWRGMGRSLLWFNVYFVCMALVNWRFGTNYMYLCRKPDAPTLLDVFGEWPWYILGGELLAVVLFTLVFIPFLFKKA